MARTLDIIASEPHFHDHLEPVWRALPLGLKGTFWVTGKAATTRKGRRWTGHDHGSVALVASYLDMLRAKAAGMNVILMEHGAGQTYVGGSKENSYVGGPGRDDCLAVLVPNERAARIHESVYPNVPVYVIGCPKLDHWIGKPYRDYIGISFHWGGMKDVPESGNAFDYYRDALPGLRQKFKMLGHAHPRGSTSVKIAMASVNMSFQPDFEMLVNACRLYVTDNSSTLFEFAALDRPVVVLNAPHFRRDVEHGGRFWEWADVGAQCDHPSYLRDTITYALTDPPEIARRRREIVREVYGGTIGIASGLAVKAISEVLTH